MTEDSLIIPRCIKNSLVSLNPTINKNANPKQWTKEERCAGVAAWTAALCSRSAANYSAALAHRIHAAEARLSLNPSRVTTAAVGPPSSATTAMAVVLAAAADVAAKAADAATNAMIASYRAEQAAEDMNPWCIGGGRPGDYNPHEYFGATVVERGHGPPVHVPTRQVKHIPSPDWLCAATAALTAAQAALTANGVVHTEIIDMILEVTEMEGEATATNNPTATTTAAALAAAAAVAARATDAALKAESATMLAEQNARQQHRKRRQHWQYFPAVAIKRAPDAKPRWTTVGRRGKPAPAPAEPAPMQPQSSRPSSRHYGVSFAPVQPPTIFHKSAPPSGTAGRTKPNHTSGARSERARQSKLRTAASRSAKPRRTAPVPFHCHSPLLSRAERPSAAPRRKSRSLTAWKEGRRLWKRASRALFGGRKAKDSRRGQQWDLPSTSQHCSRWSQRSGQGS